MWDVGEKWVKCGRIKDFRFMFADLGGKGGRVVGSRLKVKS